MEFRGKAKEGCFFFLNDEISLFYSDCAHGFLTINMNLKTHRSIHKKPVLVYHNLKKMHHCSFKDSRREIAECWK